MKRPKALESDQDAGRNDENKEPGGANKQQVTHPMKAADKFRRCNGLVWRAGHRRASGRQTIQPVGDTDTKDVKWTATIAHLIAGDHRNWGQEEKMADTSTSGR